MKAFPEIDSITIGIKLWLAPQISEHWPKKIPGRWLINLTWLMRPGTASAFTPKEGTDQACKTSAEEINIRTWVLNGIIVWLSVSKSRNILVSPSVLGIMYESNSKKDCFPENQKSEYSYLQYHWCPIAFSVKELSIDSSNMYNNKREGRAIWTKINAGITVQILSTICISNKFLLIKEFFIIEVIINPTSLIINIKTRLIKSCKKINSSIIGEFPSCKPNWPQVIII